MNYGHGGDIYAGEEIRLDFSISVNPMGLPAAARERALSATKPRCSSFTFRQMHSI